MKCILKIIVDELTEACTLVSSYTSGTDCIIYIFPE